MPSESEAFDQPMMHLVHVTILFPTAEGDTAMKGASCFASQNAVAFDLERSFPYGRPVQVQDERPFLIGRHTLPEGTEDI